MFLVYESLRIQDGRLAASTSSLGVFAVEALSLNSSGQVDLLALIPNLAAHPKTQTRIVVAQ